MLAWLLLLLLPLVLYLKRLHRLSKWSHFPGRSSLSSLPIFGHGYLLARDPLRRLLSLRREHGPIFRLDVGKFPSVFLCDRADIAEAFRKDAFSGRPVKEMHGLAEVREVDREGDITGVSATTGQAWKEHRKFMMSTLGDLGMGRKETMEEVLGQEAESFCRRIEDQIVSEPDKRARIRNTAFLATTNNVIWRILTGAAAGENQEEIRELSAHVGKMFVARDPGSLWNQLQINNLWFARAVRALGLRQSLLENVEPMKRKCREEIAKHEADAEGNYISRHLARIEACTSPDSIFSPRRSQDQLFGGMFDLFLTGSDTSATFLEWSMAYMTAYPDVQERVASEIADVVGKGSPVALEHRSGLDYTMATVEEIMRLTPQVGMSVAHYVTEDTVFKGLLFPRGTQVFSLQYAVNRDPAHFDEPDAFRPTRFLDRSTGRFRSDEHVSLFGIGRRRCVGEVLARAETFVFFANLMGRFRFTAAKEREDVEESTPGIMFYPKDLDVIVEKRY